MIARLAIVFFFGYVLMLLTIGASGIFIARWELSSVFAVPVDSMKPIEQATLLNQYRFLKAMELAFGLFCAAFRREIFRPGMAHGVFLAGAALGVVGRGLSLAIDGNPSPIFIAFIALELITVVLVYLRVRQERGRAT